MPHRIRQFEALRAAAFALTSDLDLAGVLQGVVDQARALVNARYAALGVLNEERTAIEQFITSGLSAEARAEIGPFPRGHGLLGVMIHDARPIRIPDIADDPRAAGFPPHHPPMHSLLGVPIISKGRVFGNLYLTDKQGDVPAAGVSGPDQSPGQSFSAADQETVELFAVMAAIAIENARLHRRSEQLSIARERERFAMDLHDGIIQSIYAVGLTLDDARFHLDEQPVTARARVDKAIHDLNDVVADLRNYILGLEPHSVRARGLVDGIGELARELRANSFMKVDVALEEGLAGLVDAGQSPELLHIVKEALTNIRKHARATAAQITMAQVDGELQLIISDNGDGFDPADLGDSGNGLGNMQRRARTVGGRMELRTSRGQGTQIRVLFPPGTAEP